MEFIFCSMPHYNRQQHILSKWFRKLEQRFDLAEIKNNAKKIKPCQIYIGQPGENILNQLRNDSTWMDAKIGLLLLLGEGTQEGDSWNALK